MTNEEILIQAQITLIAMLQDDIKQTKQQLKNEKNARLQVEADNDRLWRQLYGADGMRSYREGSEWNGFMQ